MSTNKTVLITGGTGFIGSHIVERLLQLQYKIILLKRTSSNIYRISNQIENIISYDIDNIDLEDIFKNNSIDYVIHLATYYTKEESLKDIHKLVKSNIQFPLSILELGKKYKIKGFIDTGTFFEYEHDNHSKISEETPKKPYNLYAATKLSFRELLKYYSKDIKIIRLILFSPYGPKDNQKLISLLWESFVKEKEIHITKAEQKLDWTYVEDISYAYELSLNFISSMKTNFEEFIIGSGDAKSIQEVISNIQDIFPGTKPPIFFDKPYSKNEIMYSECDFSKAGKFLKWAPKFTLKEGLFNIKKEYEN